MSGRTHHFRSIIDPILQFVPRAHAQEANDGFMDGGVDEELFVEEDNHVGDCA